MKTGAEINELLFKDFTKNEPEGTSSELFKYVLDDKSNNIFIAKGDKCFDIRISNDEGKISQEDLGRGKNIKFSNNSIVDVFWTNTDLTFQRTGTAESIQKIFKDVEIKKYRMVFEGEKIFNERIEKGPIKLSNGVQIQHYMIDKELNIEFSGITNEKDLDQLYLSFASAWGLLFGTFPSGYRYILGFEEESSEEPIFIKCDYRDLELDNGLCLIDDPLLAKGGDYYADLLKKLGSGESTTKAMNILMRQDFAKLINIINDEPIFMRIVWSILKSRKIELELRGSILSVAIEMLGNYFLKDVDKYVIGAELESELKNRIYELIKNMKIEFPYCTSGLDYIKERKFNRMREKTNGDKLIKSFEHAGLELSKAEKKIVNHRNTFLHGRIPDNKSKKHLDLKKMMKLYSTVIIAMDMLLVRAILAHLKIDIKIPDYVNLHSIENLDKTVDEISKNYISILSEEDE